LTVRNRGPRVSLQVKESQIGRRQELFETRRKGSVRGTTVIERVGQPTVQPSLAAVVLAVDGFTGARARSCLPDAESPVAACCALGPSDPRSTGSTIRLDGERAWHPTACGFDNVFAHSAPTRWDVLQ
jgi:hypothetical protein